MVERQDIFGRLIDSGKKKIERKRRELLDNGMTEEQAEKVLNEKGTTVIMPCPDDFRKPHNIFVIGHEPGYDLGTVALDGTPVYTREGKSVGSSGSFKKFVVYGQEIQGSLRAYLGLDGKVERFEILDWGTKEKHLFSV